MATTKFKVPNYVLWPNLAVGVVVLIQIAANQFPNVRVLLHVLAYELIYANLVSALALLLVGVLLQTLVRRKLPLAPTFALCIIVVIPVGILLVQTLLMWIRFQVPPHFWLEYYHSLRVCLPLALVFGLGAFV